VLIAAVIAVLGLGAVGTAVAGYWDGGSKLDCADDDSVRECVYEAPETNITHGPTGYTNDSTPQFSFSSDQEDVEFACKVDDERRPKCPATFTVGSPLSQGAHTFSVSARSNGHTVDATPASRSFVVDTVAPVTSITGGPAGLTNDSTPSFVFKSNEPSSTFQCRVDGGAYGPCGSPRLLSRLNDGNHTFYVRAIDRAHNMDPTPASRAFKVDTAAPNTNIIGGPTGSTSDSTPSFSFNSTEPGSKFQCRVDGGAFAPCSSPRATAPLGDGPHSFSVRAIDEAGNVDASPATRSFSVDATPPNTTITSGPSGSTTDNTPTFGFRSTEPGTFQCKVDGAPFTSCASPKTTSPLAVGGHTFSVRAIDNAGHVDPSPATRSFNVKRR
jgi:large repetitive protein